MKKITTCKQIRSESTKQLSEKISHQLEVVLYNHLKSKGIPVNSFKSVKDFLEETAIVQEENGIKRIYIHGELVMSYFHRIYNTPSFSIMAGLEYQLH